MDIEGIYVNIQSSGLVVKGINEPWDQNVWYALIEPVEDFDGHSTVNDYVLELDTVNNYFYAVHDETVVDLPKNWDLL